MNLGIFGGTFNPIHRGHINASLRFYDEAKLDKLFVIPDRVPPHKEAKVVSPEHRLNMLHLVYDNKDITGNRNIEISDIELLREGKSYTIVTLRDLKNKFPDAKLFLYTGSDMFYTLESWKEGESILRMCAIYTAAREINEKEKLAEYAAKYKNAYGTDCIIGNFEPVVLSSTQVRDCFSGQNDKKSCYFTNNLLTDEVNRYIMENDLYCNEEKCDYAAMQNRVKEDLPRLVTEKRLSHILSVVKCARLLSDFFVNLGAQLDSDKVILAAYMHDITKCMDQNGLCQKYGISLSRDDKASMQTVHAITGAYYAKDIYGADDEICSAIHLHTVGGKGMTLMEKIIFVSDYCEETRQHNECISSRNRLNEMIQQSESMPKNDAREYAYRIFDHITAEILGKTIKYLTDSGSPIHGQTLSTFEDILSKYKDDTGFRQLSEKYL